MNKYALALIFGAVALTAQAADVEVAPLSAPDLGVAVAPVLRDLPAEQAEPAAEGFVEAPVSVPLPGGVVTTTHPLKIAFLEKSGSKPLLFRPSENVPEMVNEDLIRGMREGDGPLGGFTAFAGYLPGLKVLPCEKGCVGKDYEKAVAHLVKGYRSHGGIFAERGEMIVQVRWFHSRNFLQRASPFGSDLFGISFLYEGKLVSIGRKSMAGSNTSAVELAELLGGRLAVELAVTMGMGAKPPYLNVSEGVVETLTNATVAIDGVLGLDDVRSRIEPATLEAHAHLMPAVDGIAPGEIEPVDRMHYITGL